MSKGKPFIAAFAGLVLLLTSVVVAAGAAFPGANPWPYAPTSDSPVLAVVGDIACQPGAPQGTEKPSDLCTNVRWEAQTATAQQIEQMKPDLVAILGDEQYENGYLSDFQGSFDRSYGAFKMLHRPSPGNHEYYDNKGQVGVKGFGYFDYYNGYQIDPNTGNPLNVTVPGGTASQPQPLANGQAGPFGMAGDGWYSYNLGAWHIISLNIECATQPGGCNANGAWLSSETQWLAQDLGSNHSSCTMVYWHQPAFSATNSPSTEGGMAKALWWPMLYQNGVDVVLNGHDHVYARFAPMDPTGNVDPVKGIREFVVGTGGESLDALSATPFSPTPVRLTDNYYGVMALTLSKTGYSWNFASAMPGDSTVQPPTYSDAGNDRCHGQANGAKGSNQSLSPFDMPQQQSGPIRTQQQDPAPVQAPAPQSPTTGAGPQIGQKGG